MLDQIMPELPVSDVAGGVAYYRDVLGFSVNYQQHDIAVMDRDVVRVLLIARTERHTGIGSWLTLGRWGRSAADTFLETSIDLDWDRSGWRHSADSRGAQPTRLFRLIASFVLTSV
jgi:hypothetical protein